MRRVRRQEVQQLLGKQFHIAKNGLDPAEVTAFLEEVTGSTDTALERLKRYSSLQRLSETVCSMAEDTRKTAEQIKEQARREAEEEKAQLIKESQQEVKQIIDETKTRCVACVESTNSILMEATKRAQETLDLLLGEVKDDLCNITDVTYYNSNPADERVNEELPTPQHEVSGIPPNAESQDMTQRQQSPETQQRHLITAEPETTKDHTLQPNEVNFETELEETIDNALKSAEVNFETELEETIDNALKSAEVNLEKVLEETKDHKLRPNEMNFEKENEDKPSNAEIRANTQAKDNYNLYTGKLTLLILGEADRLWMSELRQRLDNISGINVLMEAGSDAGEIIITLSLVKPVALTPVLLDMPYVEKVIEDDHKTNKLSKGLPGFIGYNSGEELPETTLMVLIGKNGNSKLV